MQSVVLSGIRSDGITVRNRRNWLICVAKFDSKGFSKVKIRLSFRIESISVDSTFFSGEMRFLPEMC